jgi:hypothetical protein
MSFLGFKLEVRMMEWKHCLSKDLAGKTRLLSLVLPIQYRKFILVT